MKKNLTIALIFIVKSYCFKNAIKISKIASYSTRRYIHSGRPAAEDSRAPLWVIQNLKALKNDTDLKYVDLVNSYYPELRTAIASAAAVQKIRGNTIAQWAALTSESARRIWHEDIINDTDIEESDKKTSFLIIALELKKMKKI